MSCCEFELALLVPTTRVKVDIEQSLEQSYVDFKGNDYKKTVRFRIPSWQPVKFKLRRFYNWLNFVWCHSRARKCRKLCFLTLFVLFFTLFMILLVLIPLAFKYSINFQQSLVFQPRISSHAFYDEVIEFEKYDKKTYYKPKNLYVVVDKVNNVTLGLWSLTRHSKNNDFDKLSEKPYLLYFHHFIGDRRTYTHVYNQLLENFNIIAFDYRGYADSCPGDLSEKELVSDSVQIYKWLKQNTNSSIFVWGDRLGGAVATRTLNVLQNENIEPFGLILENPFLSASDYLKHNWFIATMVSYTSWFKQTITDPLEESVLNFPIKRIILNTNCPIMFVIYNHIFDDNIYSATISYGDFMYTDKHIRVSSMVRDYFDYRYTNSDFYKSISYFVRASTVYRQKKL